MNAEKTDSFLNRYRKQNIKQLIKSSLDQVLSTWIEHDLDERLDTISRLREADAGSPLNFDVLPSYVIKVWSDPADIFPALSKISEQERREMVLQSAAETYQKYASIYQPK